MEFLFRLFKKASCDPSFHFHPHCKKLRGLTHFLFDDDLILISKVDPSSLQHLMIAFPELSSRSGLEANMTESQVVFGGGGLFPMCKNITFI